LPNQLPDGLKIPEAQIRADLTEIAKHAMAVRTYASTQGLERVPEIARELGLTVTLGIWLDKDVARNEREIANRPRPGARYPNVTRCVVGNETYLRHEHTAAELVKIIRRVKRDSPVPVATADHWKTFIDHPELVDAVDQVSPISFPTGRCMPKETGARGVAGALRPAAGGVPGQENRHRRVRLAERRAQFQQAVPNPITQAVLLRDFVARAMQGASTTTSSRRSTSPRNCSRQCRTYWASSTASLRPKFAWSGPAGRP